MKFSECPQCNEFITETLPKHPMARLIELAVKLAGLAMGVRDPHRAMIEWLSQRHRNGHKTIEEFLTEGARSARQEPDLVIETHLIYDGRCKQCADFMLNLQNRPAGQAFFESADSVAQERGLPLGDVLQKYVAAFHESGHVDKLQKFDAIAALLRDDK